MCEPYHSISQFSQIDGATAQSPTSIIETHPSIVKIDDYLHVSAFGMGHSESQRHKARNVDLPHTRYETHWWNRTTEIDGYFHGEDFDKDHALKCADIYAHRTVIGSLSKFRRFLEVSMAKTHIPYMYLDHFRECLNSKGRAELDRRLKLLIGSASEYNRYFRLDGANIEKAIKVMCGLTRKREYMNPEWSDDALWVPKTNLVLPENAWTS